MSMFIIIIVIVIVIIIIIMLPNVVLQIGETWATKGSTTRK